MRTTKEKPEQILCVRRSTNEHTQRSYERRWCGDGNADMSRTAIREYGEEAMCCGVV